MRKTFDELQCELVDWLRTALECAPIDTVFAVVAEIHHRTEVLYDMELLDVMRPKKQDESKP